jgi:hypothetical protein
MRKADAVALMPIPDRDDDVVISGGDHHQRAEGMDGPHGPPAIRGKSSLFSTTNSLMPCLMVSSTYVGGMLRAFSSYEYPVWSKNSILLKTLAISRPI